MQVMARSEPSTIFILLGVIHWMMTLGMGHRQGDTLHIGYELSVASLQHYWLIYQGTVMIVPPCIARGDDGISEGL